MTGTARVLLGLGAVLAVAVAVTAVAPVGGSGDPRVVVHHAPEHYTRRAGHLTVNVTGELQGGPGTAHFRLNEGDWRAVPQGGLRLPGRTFTIEMHPEALQLGENCLDFDVEVRKQQEIVERVCFGYDERAVEVPFHVTWGEDSVLDAQDGRWETVERNGEWFVRPTPGSEGYDRILLVSGAFAGERRIELDLVFRGRIDAPRPFGVGVLPLWGGHPDEPETFPRRGWIYGLAWYYSIPEGVGAEMATKWGDGDLDKVGAFRTSVIEPDTRYRLVAEVRRVDDDQNGEGAYLLRTKWWEHGTENTFSWIEIRDDSGASLPRAEYAVALLAHRAQVEFGEVRVLPLPEGTAEERQR